MSVLVTIEAVAIALLALLVAGLLRSHAEILRALHDLGVGIHPDADTIGSNRPRPGLVESRSPGTPASDLVGTTPTGDAIAIGVAGAHENTLLAFLSSGCLTCAGFWEAFADVERLSVPGKARLVVATKGPEHESQSRVAELAPPNVPVVMSTEAWGAYNVPMAPYFIYVDSTSEHIVGEGAAATWDHVADLMSQALADAGMTDQGERRRRRAAAGDTASRVDADLLSAGLHPGHPSLYQPPESSDPPRGEQ